MVLRRYWSLIVARWWVIVLTAVIATGVSSYIASKDARVFTAEARVLVAKVPTPQDNNFYVYDDYYNWLSSEYIVDDFTQIVTSMEFAKDTASQMQQTQGASALTAEQIKGSLAADRKHRVLTLHASWGDPAIARSVVNAAAAALTSNVDKYHVRPTGDTSATFILDQAIGVSSNRTMRMMLAGLRALLGVMAGFGLVFLLGYLDETLQTSKEVEQLLGLSVVGALPEPSRASQRLARRRAVSMPPAASAGTPSLHSGRGNG